MSATICKTCGLPILRGAAGYAGPQCVCKYQTLPQMYDSLAAECALLKAENERLKTVPMKYRRMEHNAKLQYEVDTLRAQLDEARSLLLRSFSAPSLADAQKWYRDAGDWLEANK